ncbi:MAG: hypothetical protein ACOVQE_01635 [Chitinophagaceae bacterium]
MKKLITLVVLAGVFTFAQANENKPTNDSLTIEQKIAQLQKQVAELNEQIKLLTQAKNELANNKPKKLVIERRGSKQAYYQK